ncbi:MAG: arsenate reductase ArsC [Gemmatimonadales bacterium]
MTPPDKANPERTVIFLCVANSARSQMAEAIAGKSAPDGWRVFSAGSNPGLLHPLAVETMSEIDIDISERQPKGLSDVPLDKADVIVTLCSEEVCPAVPENAEHLQWPLPDPATQGDTIRSQFDAFRATRDTLKERIDAFWKEHS